MVAEALADRRFRWRSSKMTRGSAFNHERQLHRTYATASFQRFNQDMSVVRAEGRANGDLDSGATLAQCERSPAR